MLTRCLLLSGGVNVIAYYSTSVFEDAGYSLTIALLISMGTGILNWVFALPAFFTIVSSALSIDAIPADSLSLGHVRSTPIARYHVPVPQHDDVMDIPLFLGAQSDGPHGNGHDWNVLVRGVLFTGHGTSAILLFS